MTRYGLSVLRETQKCKTEFDEVVKDFGQRLESYFDN